MYCAEQVGGLVCKSWNPVRIFAATFILSTRRLGNQLPHPIGSMSVPEHSSRFLHSAVVLKCSYGRQHAPKPARVSRSLTIALIRVHGMHSMLLSHTTSHHCDRRDKAASGCWLRVRCRCTPTSLCDITVARPGSCMSACQALHYILMVVSRNSRVLQRSR
jgi:hypothetical protein